jgi:inosine-uridine nucleoside N-ribohydrolase
MGGAYWMETAEHNIKCDPEAAEIVFRSGIPITACGLDVTTQVWLRGPDVDEIARSMDALGPILADQIRAWWVFKSADPHAAAEEGQANNPHDPLAVLAARHPELFKFEMCDVSVGLDETNLARTLISNCGNGAIRIASSVQVSQAERAIVQGIVGAGQG